MSARSRRGAHQRAPAIGFTLLEILVVVVIVGVMAAAVVLSVGGNAARQLDREANRFRTLLAQACEQAELGGRELGVLVGSRGYAFVAFTDIDWRPLPAENVLRARQWPDGIAVDLLRDGRSLALIDADAATAQPQVVCFASGELTPFSLRLALGDARSRVDARTSGDVAVSVPEGRTP